MKRLEDMEDQELLDFLKGQSIMQLNIYCDTYRLVRRGDKESKVDRIHKHLMNARGYSKMRGEVNGIRKS